MCRRADLSGLDLERAIELLQWPLLLGEHSDLKDSVFLHLGKYGHYFQVGNTRVPVLKVRHLLFCFLHDIS